MKKYIFLAVALLLLTAACSNDENNNGQEKPIRAVQFSFTNEDFGADETLSRTTGAAEIKPQTVDLGDCEAEISVESEPAVKTRGTMTNANGHYTIRAYQGGTLKGEMKGMFSGGAFTPDATSPQEIGLSAGTYDFIAFNDDVIPSGNDLTVDRTKAETARMGTTTAVITATPQKQKVMFTMKHVGCRLRTQFVCKKHIPNDITAKLEATAANVIPATTAYHPATKVYTSTNGAMTAENSNSPASTEDPYWDSNFGQDYAYTSTSDYHYFLPTTDASKLRLTFTSGTVFWKPLTGGIIPQLSTMLPDMQSNKSYIVKIKLKPIYTYLMSDGTTGHFKDTTFGGGTKTPVGVVADPTARVAIALKNVSDETKYTWYAPRYSPHADNTTLYSSNEAAGTDMEGYKWTWETAGTTDGTIKANQQTSFPGFYAAGHYNPGVPISGTLVGKKWYLAGWGEWVVYVGKNLAFSKLKYGMTPLYGVLLDESFIQVGGTRLTYITESFLVSTQTKSDGSTGIGHDIYFTSNIEGQSTMGEGLIRPFIKY
nr:hypothetical protein [Segatella oris]